MNYLDLIIQFWKLRRSKRITSLQADLYFYLIQECNERDWENPFECTNKLICASIQISEPTLIDARNRLQQLGLIEFKSGKQNRMAPVYYIFNLKNLSRNRMVGLVEGLVETEEKGEHNKNKPNQTKQKESKSHCGEKSPPPKKKEESEIESEPHWQSLVKAWFDFNQKKFGDKPSFAGADSRHLKKIVVCLKKRAQAKKIEWTEQTAVKWINYLLEKAFQDKWMRENFLLPNLEKFMDKYILNQQEKNYGNHQTTYQKVSSNIDFSGGI